MHTSQGVVILFAGLALLGLVSAESLDDKTAASLYKLIQPYDSVDDDKQGDLDLSFDGPPDLNWGGRPAAINFGSFLRQVPTYNRNLIEDKRFGYVGSRGKRMDHSVGFRTLRELLDLYEQSARALPFRSANYRSYSNQDSALLNSKRQPHFGYHGLRG